MKEWHHLQVLDRIAEAGHTISAARYLTSCIGRNHKGSTREEQRKRETLCTVTLKLCEQQLFTLMDEAVVEWQKYKECLSRDEKEPEVDASPNSGQNHDHSN